MIRLPELVRRLGLLAACYAASVVAASGPVPLAESLAQAEHGIWVVVYSRNDCPYCEIVKRDHIAPLLSDARYRDRVQFREVRQDADSALIDFSGKQTTHARFARSQGIGFVPVVAFFNRRGEALADPIVGLRLRDFYQSYLEDSLEQALTKSY